MNKDKYNRYSITSNDAQKRIDNILRKFLPNMPLQGIFKSIRSGDIRINGNKIKQNYKVNVDDILMIYKPLLNNKTTENKIKATKTLNPNRIIFENKDILIYNKPAGLLVHGEINSLDNLIKGYLVNKVEKSLSFSPGPLHRLDRNTNGLIVFSVSLNGARTFTNMIQNNTVTKSYLTIVDGIHKNYEEWEDKIDRDERTRKSYESNTGQVAISTFTPLYHKHNKTIALIKLVTGRTHQIRVQCSIHNRPLTGDIKYNKFTQYKAYYLSAISLTFTQKNDIVNNVEDFILPLTKSNNGLINEILNEKELKIVETILQKELNKK